MSVTNHTTESTARQLVEPAPLSPCGASTGPVAAETTADSSGGALSPAAPSAPWWFDESAVLNFIEWLVEQEYFDSESSKSDAVKHALYIIEKPYKFDKEHARMVAGYAIDEALCPACQKVGWSVWIEKYGRCVECDSAEDGR